MQYVLKNNRIRNALIELAGKADVEWYPSTSLLSAGSLPADIRSQIETISQDSPTQRRKCEATYAEFDELAAARELATLEKDKGKESLAVLKRLLRDKFPKDGNKLTLGELVETAYDEIVEAADLNYTEDPKGQNYCNAWWCFAEVAGQDGIRNDIFFAEANQVGYKRTTRHPAGIPQPNDLFTADEAGNIVIDTENPKTILDGLRKAHVFSR